jgi:hypothetical protein
MKLHSASASNSLPPNARAGRLIQVVPYSIQDDPRESSRECNRKRIATGLFVGNGPSVFRFVINFITMAHRRDSWDSSESTISSEDAKTSKLARLISKLNQSHQQRRYLSIVSRTEGASVESLLASRRWRSS